MKLSNLNKKIFILFISFFFTSTLFSEDIVDIWKKENLKKKNNSSKIENTSLNKTESNININTKPAKEIEFSLNTLTVSSRPIYGIYDPNENNLTLEMWKNSEGTRVKDTIERINKIKLSPFAEEVFVKTLFTISNLPDQNMTDEEFINYKIDWLINNEKDALIYSFLDKNKNFPNKKKIIKYLVDKNIAKANLKEACKNISLINKDIKDPYLGQFNVVCLFNQGKKNEAQLFVDLLREQKLSNKFFDDKIDYLLGVKTKENKKIDDTNLLNFYLSSITIPNFTYIPNKKTDIKIWQYLTAANLINMSDFKDNDKIKELEIAANNNRLETSYVLEVYKNIKFNFNDLLNIDEVYQTLDPINARALVYQKILLSDNTEKKLKYLFLLNNLFKNENLLNIFNKYLSQELKILDTEKIPAQYQTLIAENIIHEKEKNLGEVKYNDRRYHTSKVARYYVEQNISKKYTEKELQRIHKKLKKNKKYRISLDDIILLESLKSDGFLIPKEIKYKEIVKNNSPPAELLNLVKNNEIGLVLLRIVELIGEDDLIDLDSHTIYFINHLIVEAGLINFRIKILTSVLPDRTEI